MMMIPGHQWFTRVEITDFKQYRRFAVTRTRWKDSQKNKYSDRGEIPEFENRDEI